VDALLGEIRHVAHDILLEEQDEGGSGAGAIKGGSLIASSSTSQPKGRELHPHGRGKWLGNLPWWSFEKMSLVRTPYDIFKELAPGKFPRKPVNSSIFIVGLFLSPTSPLSCKILLW
jgi:hypothetical protein